MINQTMTSLFRGVRVNAAVGLILLAACYSGTDSMLRAQTPAKAETAPAVESKGGPKEGIKVHGHWTIDVRNPDGTLVSHREFENAMTPYGRSELVLLMIRQTVWSTWQVRLFGTACRDQNGVAGHDCVIDEPVNSGSQFPNLKIGGGTSCTSPCGPFGDTFRLSGTATVDLGGSSPNGTITGVGTFLHGECAPNVSPVQCVSATAPRNGNVFDFTATPLLDSSGQPAPLTVGQGRIIQFTVDISFS